MAETEKKVHFHIEVSEEKKDQLRIQLLSDGVKVIANFFRPLIEDFVADKIPEETLDKIKAYQEANPGKEEETYINVMITEAQSIGLQERKYKYKKILPQHLCRYYMEQYLQNKLPQEYIKRVRLWK